MHQVGNFQNILFKQAHRVGHGQHDHGGFVGQCRRQRRFIHAAVRAGFDVYYRKPAHIGGGRVGAVGGIGHDYFRAVFIFPRGVIGFSRHNARQLPMGARRRLKRKRG